MSYAASGSDAGSTVLGGVLSLVIVAAYLTPILVASFRRSANMNPVVVVNIFLGWTVIGWVVALAMAVSGPSGRPPRWQ